MDPPPPGAGAAVPVADSFPHPRHRSLPCLTCHVSTTGHGRLAFERPRGCQICHHQAPKTSKCATCHTPDELAGPHPVQLTVTVPDRAPRTRSAGFRHPSHAAVTCVTCHVEPVTLAAEAPVVTCRSCHDDHHVARTDCAACHSGPEVRAAHARPIEGHQACDACHAPAVVARLVPTRTLCLTCHRPEADHYPAKECTVCHFQASPEEYRAHLRKAEGRS
jgi:hypothetical protein